MSAVVVCRTLDLTGPMAGSRCGETRDEAVPDQRAVRRIATETAGTGEAHRGASCAGFASGAWSLPTGRASMAGCKNCRPAAPARRWSAEQRRRNSRPLEVASPATEPALDGPGAGTVAGHRGPGADRGLAASSKGPSVHPVERPGRLPGRSATAISPTPCRPSWSQSSAYTDDVGDLDNSGPSGWAAEHVGARASPPMPGETPPSSFATFGEPQPSPYHLGPATPTQVKGAAVAYRYTLTRPGGFEATRHRRLAVQERRGDLAARPGRPGHHGEPSWPASRPERPVAGQDARTTTPQPARPAALPPVHRRRRVTLGRLVRASSPPGAGSSRARRQSAFTAPGRVAPR